MAIALVDCNNFYASCERVFNPKLECKPVIILSNNDGCVIARSNETKAMGIKMGTPFFEIKNFCTQHNIHVYSSNYTLYADMSARVMQTLSELSARQEIYSIDESFLDLTGYPDLSAHAQLIRKTVKQYTGIPVGVGIANTKVLAKLANYLAKKYPQLNGVCNLIELGAERTNKAMQITPVDEIWGVGRKVALQLKQMGIKTVYDLKIANPKIISKRLSVNIERIIYELNDIQCLDIETNIEPNKQIISSRSFGTTVTTRDGLLSSLTYHTEQIGKKLRQQNLYARQMTVFAHTNRFKDNYFASSINVVFSQATDSFRYMATALDNALDNIYKPYIHYKKAGIIISDLITDVNQTVDLFDNVNIIHDELLPTLESIKKKYGKHSIKLASEKLSEEWRMQRNYTSAHFTTDIDDILVVS